MDLCAQSAEIRRPWSKWTCVPTYACVRTDPSILMEFQNFPMHVRISCNSPSMVSSIQSSNALGSGRQSLPFQTLRALRGGGQSDSKKLALKTKVESKAPGRELRSKGNWLKFDKDTFSAVNDDIDHKKVPHMYFLQNVSII